MIYLLHVIFTNVLIFVSKKYIYWTKLIYFEPTPCTMHIACAREKKYEKRERESGVMERDKEIDSKIADI